LKEKNLELSDFYRIIYTGRWYILVTMIAAVWFTIYLNGVLEPVYEATATLMVKNVGIQENIFTGQDLTPHYNMEDQIQLLKSRRLALKVVETLASSPYAPQLSILGNDSVRYPPEKSARLLNRALSIRFIRNSNFIHVSVSASTPFEAQYLTNAVAQEFYRQNVDFSKIQFSELSEFLDDQLSKVTAKLREAEEALTQFKEKNKVAVLSKETELLVTSITEIKSQLNSIQIDIRGNEEELNNLRSQYLHGKSTIVEDVAKLSTPVIEELLAQITDKQTLIANLQTKSDEPGSREIIRKTEQEIRQIKESLARETRKLAESGDYAGDPIQNMQELFDRIIELEVANKTLEARRQALESVVQAYEAKLEELPATSLQLARLERDRELNEKIYTMLTEKQEETQILSAGKIGTVQIIDLATAPEKPVKPNRRLNIILAVILGLLLGLGISFLRFLLDTRIRTSEDLNRLGIEPLGVIPFIDSQKINRELHSLKTDLSEVEKRRVSQKLITHFAPRSSISEAYRTLRTNVLYHQNHENPRVILLTSSTIQEGKTLTSCNLAVVLAQTGERVLLIDADMRRPSAHQVLHVSRAVGLSNLLQGSVTREQAIQHSDIINLDVLPAGEIPPNPSELLASPVMTQLLATLRDEYDRIVVDTPPVVPVTDAAVMARLADVYLLVMASGKVHRREVRTALMNLSHVRAPIIGGVLNSLDIRRLYGSYYYYYYYYNYYYYYGTDKKKTRRKKRKWRRRDSAVRDAHSIAHAKLESREERSQEAPREEGTN
jgi:tyrosine-protein kinase Etk/Wzc